MKEMNRKHRQAMAKDKGMEKPVFWMLSDEFLESVELHRAMCLFLLRKHEPITLSDLEPIIEDMWQRFRIAAAFGLLVDQGKMDAVDGGFRLSSKERKEVEEDQAMLDSEENNEEPEPHRKTK